LQVTKWSTTADNSRSAAVAAAAPWLMLLLALLQLHMGDEQGAGVSSACFAVTAKS
jgi:hypothetical protein